MPQAYEEALTGYETVSEEPGSPTWFKHVRGNFCSTKTLPKNGVRPQLIPEHEMNCLSSPQAELLYEYMQEDKVIDPVKLDLCKYQAIEPTNPYYSAEEDNDNRIEVSPYEALVINDTSKIGAIESPSNPEPQQEILTADQSPYPKLEPQTKQDTLVGPNEGINLQDMDRWSVFTEHLRYTVPETTAPGFDIQGQGCLDFSPERLNRSDQAKEVSMAPLEFHHMPASEYLDRYDGITSELNVNMEYDVSDPPSGVFPIKQATLPLLIFSNNPGVGEVIMDSKLFTVPFICDVSLDCSCCPVDSAVSSSGNSSNSASETNNVTSILITRVSNHICLRSRMSPHVINLGFGLMVL